MAGKKNFFVKSHGLGNDYLVFDQEGVTFPFDRETIIRLCDVHYGIGSDGILVKVPAWEGADFGLRIYNPDGSEAEKSGNGLRIFAKYLFDYGHTQSSSFSVSTPGGVVHAEIVERKNKKASQVKVAMGKAVFNAADIPVAVDTPECVDKEIEVGGKKFLINCVSVGNPHCVILTRELKQEEVMTYGPLLENHPLFPHRINVQFAMPVSASRVDILIWERGAGYTLASGSSSCAVAAVMKKKGLIGEEVDIHMPGGMLHIAIDNHWNIHMTGPVEEIVSGILSDEFLISGKK